MKPLDLNTLTFGSDDAEHEEKRGFLDRVFLKTSIYNRAKDSQREIVIGRKGSGKSAICLMLKKAFEKESITTVLVTPQSLSRIKLEQLKTSSLNLDETYLLGWKYILLVTIGIKILDIEKAYRNSPKRKETKKLLKEIHKFLAENGEIQKSLLGKVSESTSILSKLSIKIFGVEGSAETRELIVQKDIATEIEKFQVNIEKILFNLNKTRIEVLVDRADEVWNQTLESELMIIGLIKAVHDLNAVVKQVHFILFLRSDIYDVLKFNDGDKLHSAEERIEWDATDLKHLIATRGKVSLDLPTEDVDTLWCCMFEAKVKNISSFDYLLRRTLRRPRELIQFCNNALGKAQDNHHSLITEQDILLAEKQYSNWKLKDLSSEFSVQYPYLEDILSSFQGFKTSFCYTEFDKRYQETKTRLANPELQKISADKMLQILFIIGFLGARQNQEDTFVYDDRFILLPQHKCIIVHPAYHVALGLTESECGTHTNISSSRKEINISGDVVSGDKVSQTHYEPLISGSRVLDNLESEYRELLTEKAKLKEHILSFSPSDVPVLLVQQLHDIDEKIKNIEERTIITEREIQTRRTSSYQAYATSRTPALIIYLLDISSSMAESFEGQSRINILRDCLSSAMKTMIQRSIKGTMISPRYRIAMYAYSDSVYDLYGGAKTIDKAAQLGVPQLQPMKFTDTAKAFLAAENLLVQELPNMENCPAPLICHITDGEYTGENPEPIVKRIMNMSLPDGVVLVENIFISDSITFQEVSSYDNWGGITKKSELRNQYARFLFDISSPIPLSYSANMAEFGGYKISPNARMFFPGNSLELIRMAFAMSALTRGV